MFSFRPIFLFLTISATAIAEKQNLSMITNAAADIDYIIEQANAKNEIEANPIVDDATFLRRAYLNIIGRIPTYQESKTFLDNTNEDKRTKLIEQLTYSPGFSSHIFNFYANLLRLKTNQEQSGLGWHVWLRDAVESNQSYDTIVNKMLSADGHCSENPAVGYYLRDRGMLLDNISNTAKVFLGTQIGCAQCHDDPFEEWTQMQYYQLAAFGSEIKYNTRPSIVTNQIEAVVDYKVKKRGEKPTEALNKKEYKERMKLTKNEARDLNSLFRNFNQNTIVLKEGNSLRLPDDYQYNDAKPKDEVSPHVLFGTVPTASADANKTQQFADWVTSRSNPFFSKVIANRLWKHALGYGLVEPVDNWTDRTNVAHEEVLDTLVEILQITDFDVRETLRVIYHTKLFQRASCDFEVTGGATHDFRGPLLRRMSAEELYDSLLTLTKGNIDGQTNENQQYKWQRYKESIKQLTEASPEKLIALDDQADLVEDALAEPQAKAKELRAEKYKAVSAGDSQTEKKLNNELNRLYKEMNEIKKSAQNKQMSSMSMVMQNNLKAPSKTPLRASEMPQPFAAGSLARDFGASDRNTTNAQHTHASVPQALTMLNSYHIDKLITKNSLVGELLKGQHRENDRLNTLYLSIYNRYPDSKEESMFKQYSRSQIDIYILAKAMLNSKRFLFVQ